MMGFHPARFRHPATSDFRSGGPFHISLFRLPTHLAVALEKGTALKHTGYPSTFYWSSGRFFPCESLTWPSRWTVGR